MNIDFVDAEAIEAAHICQSALGLVNFSGVEWLWEGTYILCIHFEYRGARRRSVL